MTADFLLRRPARPDAAALVEVSGEIDMANADEFSATLTGAVNDARRLTVDLSRTTYLDSAAIKVLFQLARRAALTLIVPSDGVVAPVIGLAGLAAVTTVRGAQPSA